MALFSDVILTTEAILFFSTALGSLWAALLMSWREASVRGAAREERLTRQRDDLVQVMIERGLRDAIPSSVPAHKIPPVEQPGP